MSFCKSVTSADHVVRVDTPGALYVCVGGAATGGGGALPVAPLGKRGGDEVLLLTKGESEGVVTRIG